MRKRDVVGLGLVAVLALSASPGFAEGTKSREPRFSLKLSGGVANFSLGDIDDSLESINRVLTVGRYRSYSTETIPTPANWGAAWEAELRLDIIYGFSLGVSISNPIRPGTDSTVPLYSVLDSTPAGTFSSSSDVRMRPPLRLSLYYSLPVRPRLNVCMGAGVGTYSGKMAGSLDYDVNDFEGVDWYRTNWQADWRSSLGYHGSLGVEYGLSKRLAFSIDAQYRKVRLRDFSATLESDSTLWPGYFYDDDSGTLYTWGWGEEGPMGLSYGELLVWQGTPPHSASTFGGRARGRAFLDLSGISLRIGIRIDLF